MGRLNDTLFGYDAYGSPTVDEIRRVVAGGSTSGLKTGALLSLTLALLGTVAASARADERPPAARPFARCEVESQSAFGQQPRSTPRQLAGIKRIKGSVPKYPELPAGTHGSGSAVHELLIAPDGKVHRVWAVREPSLEPPFPAFNQAIIDVLREWQYTPLVVDGLAVPVCLIVTTRIHWR